MRPSQRTLVVTLVAATMFAPHAVGQSTIHNPDESTPTTLYFHIFDTFNKFVINTQPMDAEFFETGGTSFPTLTGTPVNKDLGEFDLNTVYGISTAGPVEYEFTENGRPRFHPEPGIAADVFIDESVVPTVTLYATVRDVFGNTDAAPNAMVDYTFRIHVREGDDPGRDTETLETGRLLMQGQRTFHVVNAQACDVVNGGNCRTDAHGAIEGQADPVTETPFLHPDADGIVEFQIPLEIHHGMIPKADAFNVRIDGYQGTSTGAFEEDQFSKGYLRYFSDPDHLPRLDFNIRNPIFIEFVHPQVAAGSLLIHAGVNSPFGTYDVDTDRIDVSIEGPINVNAADLTPIIAANTHVHGLHDQAAEITYLYKFRQENAPEGEYTIRFSVANKGVPDADGTIRPETVRTATATAGFVLTEQQAFGLDTFGNEVLGSAQEQVEAPTTGIVATGVMALAIAFARRSNA